MTNEGVKELYLWLSAAWPLVVKPNASDEYKLATMRTIYEAFKENTDADVLEAYKNWTASNEKYPTIKNIRNEILWANQSRRGYRPDKAVKYQLELIDDNGIEYVYGIGDKNEFTFEEFIELRINRNHLTPDEWTRRFHKRRREILKRVQAEAIEESKREAK